MRKYIIPASIILGAAILGTGLEYISYRKEMSFLNGIEQTFGEKVAAKRASENIEITDNYIIRIRSLGKRFAAQNYLEKVTTSSSQPE